MGHESRMAAARYLGLDIAWRDCRADLPANETCVAVVDSGGRILDVDTGRASECCVPSAGRSQGPEMGSDMPTEQGLHGYCFRQSASANSFKAI